jgi:DNA-binding transcriptional LysR family regulator
VLPQDHRLARRASLGPADLKDEPFISLGGEDRSRIVIDEAFGTMFPRSRMQIEAQMAESACNFVASGLGVAIVPPFIAEAFKNEGLVCRRFSPAIEMSVWQLIPTGDPVGAVTRELASFIQNALEPYWRSERTR